MKRLDHIYLISRKNQDSEPSKNCDSIKGQYIFIHDADKKCWPTKTLYKTLYFLRLVSLNRFLRSPVNLTLIMYNTYCSKFVVRQECNRHFPQ